MPDKPAFRPTWRQLERLTVEILREFGYTLDENARTGDKFIIRGPSGVAVGKAKDLNITSFVQELADRINKNE